MKVSLAIDGSQSSEVVLQALIAMGHPQEMEVWITFLSDAFPKH